MHDSETRNQQKKAERKKKETCINAIYIMLCIPLREVTTGKFLI